ncbi:hypothetical protein HRJ34_08510 [Rhizorhabdus wittichii]|uniref:DUF1795 domain-containing protein n=2 Tax=Rhizorhabdus wittichii TaxID=160791 RepID=A0A975HGI9_9SPHN|nr:hypothetical protein HRJ34_08510 [Rhizorhabdus wittichii]
MKRLLIGLSLGLAAVAPASANSLVTAGPRPHIAESRFSASPTDEWNRLSRKDGKNVEIWTRDGDQLNKVTFFGGIPSGKPLVREIDKKHQPLPKVAADMLITDIPVLLESTYRIQYAVTQMEVESQEPATLSGHKAIRFTYRFAREDDGVRRRGEAIGAFVDGQLYLVTYEAPALYFFDKDVEKYRKLAATLAL